jgi:flagellar biosynthesis/type III secretory pathway chaperone
MVNTITQRSTLIGTEVREHTAKRYSVSNATINARIDERNDVSIDTCHTLRCSNQSNGKVCKRCQFLT